MTWAPHEWIQRSEIHQVSEVWTWRCLLFTFADSKQTGGKRKKAVTGAQAYPEQSRFLKRGARQNFCFAVKQQWRLLHQLSVHGGESPEWRVKVEWTPNFRRRGGGWWNADGTPRKPTPRTQSSGHKYSGYGIKVVCGGRIGKHFSAPCRPQQQR